ncbi:MAG: twin-arginine translocase subunit TatC [Endomicrobiales bacterium]
MNEINLEHDTSLPLSTHLVHLRRSLIVSVAAVSVLSVVMFYNIDPILRKFAEPVGKLYFMSPAEAFTSKIRFSIYAGIFTGAPLVLFQVWGFVRTGMRPLEKKTAIWLTIASLLLFYSGSAFCYFAVLPASLKFLISCGSDVLVPFISVTRYISFAGGMVFMFGAIFELPLVIWFLARAGLVTAATLRKNRRYAIVLAFIVAALLSPIPDAFNQTLMAVPLLILFEIGIVAARIAERRK